MIYFKSASKPAILEWEAPWYHCNHKYTGAWLLDAIIFYKKENSCFWQVAEGYEWYIKCFVSLTSAFLVASGSEQYTKALFNFSLNIDKQI